MTIRNAALSTLLALTVMTFIGSLARATDHQPLQQPANPPSAPSAIAHLNPQQVLAQCHDPNGPGPIGVMHAIRYPNGKDLDWDVWPEITNLIAQGHADWIRASGCLAHGARYGGCASCTLELEIAWALALTRNTRAVLALRNWTTIDRACTLPFIEESEEFLAQYMAQTLAALDALKTTPEDYTDVVQDARRACTFDLKASYLNPNRCKFNGEEYVCPEIKQSCKFNGEAYYGCKPE